MGESRRPWGYTQGKDVQTDEENLADLKLIACNLGASVDFVSGNRSSAQASLCQRIHLLRSSPAEPSRIYSTTMGKRKNKFKNVVKIDLGEYEFGGEDVLPVLVQQSSKDGRRVEKTIHKVPAPQAIPSTPVFDPSPMFKVTQDASPDAQDPADEPCGVECVCSRSLSPRCFLTRTLLVVRPSAHLVP